MSLHLAHVEITCRDLDASREFFLDVVGLREQLSADGRVYLRGFGDWMHHTLVLTPGDGPGVAHIAWGTGARDDLTRLERELDERGIEAWWEHDEPGQAESLRFVAPGGHTHELVYDCHRTRPGEVTSRLHNYPSPKRGFGMEPTRIDHVNILAPDVAATSTFLQRELGFRVNERALAPDGGEAGHWMSSTNLVHDIAVMRDDSGEDARLHHVAFWLETPSRVMRAADLLVECGARIEAGPGKHGISQALFLYFFEPSGNRIELFSSGYLVFEPHWEPVLWTAADKDRVEIATTGFRVRDYVAGHTQVST